MKFKLLSILLLILFVITLGACVEDHAHFDFEVNYDGPVLEYESRNLGINYEGGIDRDVSTPIG